MEVATDEGTVLLREEGAFSPQEGVAGVGQSGSRWRRSVKSGNWLLSQSGKSLRGSRLERRG